MSKKKKQTKNNNVKVAVRYGVAVPEKPLSELIRLNCAKELFSLSKDLEHLFPFAPSEEIKNLKEVFSVTSGVIGIIQDAWQKALKEFSDGKKPPKGCYPGKCKPSKPSKQTKPTKAKPTKKATLTETEQRKIRSLRKQGLSVKAIGKELHRAEKVVADFVRALPKKK